MGPAKHVLLLVVMLVVLHIELRVLAMPQLLFVLLSVDVAVQLLLRVRRVRLH